MLFILKITEVNKGAKSDSMATYWGKIEHVFTVTINSIAKQDNSVFEKKISF